jgi:hypothetical protein
VWGGPHAGLVQVQCSCPLAHQAAYLHCKGDKVALHPRRYVEGACCGVHGGGVLAVLYLLKQDLLLVIPATLRVGWRKGEETLGRGK